MTEVIERPADSAGRTPVPIPPGLLSESVEDKLARFAEYEGEQWADELRAAADEGLLSLVVNLHGILENVDCRLGRMEKFFKRSDDPEEYPVSYSLTADPHRHHWPCWSIANHDDAADTFCHCHDDTDCPCNQLPPHPQGSGLDACGDRP
jgi:hypothetical protein